MAECGTADEGGAGLRLEARLIAGASAALELAVWIFVIVWLVRDAWLRHQELRARARSKDGDVREAWRDWDSAELERELRPWPEPRKDDLHDPEHWR